MTASIDSLAAHYGKRIILASGRRGFRIGCPMHGGSDPNCSIFESEGRIAAHCWSVGCEPSAILSAIERDAHLDAINPREWSFQGTYRRNKEPVDVWRRNNPDGSKDFPTAGPRENIRLLIHGDGDADIIIVAEGEKAARAIQRAGYTSASYLGGSQCAGLADYSALRDKTAAIWPDNDAPGKRAAEVSASKAAEAGAYVVWLLDPVEGDKADAADVPEQELPEFINELLITATLWEPPAEDAGAAEDAESREPSGHYDWRWRNLADFADIPAPVHLVEGLLIEGNITLWYAPSKTGKTRALFGLLKSLAPGGPQFCGMDLPDFPALLFTEEPPNVIGERVRDYQIPASGMHIANEAAALAMRPDDFAEAVYREFHANGGGFGLVAVDTIGPFINNQDWNDYASTTAAMAPIRQLARSLPNTALMMLHHQNKGGGTEWNSALGSTALPANADQLVRMARAKNGQHTITVGGRNKAGPFPFDEPVTISISSEGVEFVGTASDVAEELLADHLGEEPLTIKDLIDAMGEDAPGRKAIDAALLQMVKAGKAVKVTNASGSRGATYQRKGT